MNTLIKRLPLFAFVLAAFAAFAFSSPDLEEPRYATMDDGETWIQVNDQTNPVNYNCNLGTEICLYSQPDLAHPVGSPNKEFVLIP
ncbi:hypothetical protein LV84_04151 [Algoriphagus ratkowskyi]|uniref:Uncharacterized protein n=1 Tax=Algoriphagus ratkowskyi TaxID=57028 RepID=A0A2W7QPP2_9BACT|nr:DUF6520 family protein [Algoriphagus ratkowskyi]PZX49961.1 hypothetical protein LV84_04151 [Algoriphagus ratkowskyi]TXD75530.1 hypothetical protein ESW18_20170 [Algoriphagus ratkowskyi]